ncbi:MmcQ/YjbR family DNA-binding protein [Pontibacter sp. JH31]|uniref:MmcQ/YjbR family DNA-binding protein n=1 Tax=Pontibacter aquaedesilientis TaxID=2766980 RepID=A0ABR7XDA0_9BACT|nr:MmcQ/YjbR family DNA-binding protein [Pontibacter aquaedesilientis]MBD1396275.1 MmcQ/YjbR family DNA-binding protein [Pontibacter aquaedesilientis]
MNIEALREICLGLPGVAEDVKWGADLCFLVGAKMFCVTGLEGEPGVSFKVGEDEFEELSASHAIIPAPYMARNKWVQVKAWDRLTRHEWESYVKQSYELVKAKLPKRIQKEIEASQV